MTIENPPQPRDEPVCLPDVNAKLIATDEALVSEVIPGIKAAGACIIRNVYDSATVKQLTHEVNPYLTQDGRLTCESEPLPCDGPLLIESANSSILSDFQKNVATVSGLAGKSETYALQVLGNGMWTKVRDHFLTYEHGPYWVCPAVSNSL